MWRIWLRRNQQHSTSVVMSPVGRETYHHGEGTAIYEAIYT